MESFLFLSATATIKGIIERTVFPSQMSRGLYYFGTVRTDVMGDKVASNIMSSFATVNAQKLAQACTVLQQALLAAEADGRVEWPPYFNYRNIEKLKALLLTQGVNMDAHRNLFDASKARRVLPLYPNFNNQQIVDTLRILGLSDAIKIVWI